MENSQIINKENDQSSVNDLRTDLNEFRKETKDDFTNVDNNLRQLYLLVSQQNRLAQK